MKKIALGALLVLAACGGGATQAPPPSAPTSTAAGAPQMNGLAGSPQNAVAAVEAPDRDAADRALDEGRKPLELLSFCAIPLDGKVAELAAGGGYTTELLARTVGPNGKVWGENPKFILGFAEKPWSARLAKPADKNVVRVDRELDDPLPPDAKDLAAVVMNLFYHDTVWMNVDRDKMNKAIFAALKPGGVYCVIDHSARPGTGTSDVKTLHRIDESVVKGEIEKAGFKLEAESDAWKNPSDTRDWNASPMAAKEKRGTSDRFALKFVKP